MKLTLSKALPCGRKRGNGVFMNILFGITLALLALFILWLYAIAPQMNKRPSMKPFAKYDYAHRGLHNAEKGIPENSLKAFRLAAESGFGVELDVQLTADHQVVVIHDDNLQRVCGVDLNVRDLTYDQLQTYPLSGTEETIPTLQQALDAIGRRTPVIVELKHYNPVKTLCPLVWEILEKYTGLYCIESFQPLIVKWFKDNQPQVVRGQLMERLEKNDQLNKFEAFVGRNLLTNFLTRPNFEAYDYHNRSRASMWLAKNLLNMAEVSWTVKDPETYKKLKNKNCIVIFEGFEPFTEVKTISTKNGTLDKTVGAAPVTISPEKVSRSDK